MVFLKFFQVKIIDEQFGTIKGFSLRENILHLHYQPPGFFDHPSQAESTTQHHPRVTMKEETIIASCLFMLLPADVRASLPLAKLFGVEYTTDITQHLSFAFQNRTLRAPTRLFQSF